MGTTVPVLVGAGVEIEFRRRVRLNTEVGYLGRSYVGLINTVVQAFDGYNDQTADLLSETISGSLVLHFDLGWYPERRSRWYFGAGFSFALLGSGLTGKEALEAALGTEIESAEEGLEFDAASNLYLVTAHGGYRLPVADRFAIRFELGALYAFGSTNTLDGPLRPQAMEALERVYDAYLSDVYTTYVISPMIGVWGQYTL